MFIYAAHHLAGFQPALSLARSLPTVVDETDGVQSLLGMATSTVLAASALVPDFLPATTPIFSVEPGTYNILIGWVTADDDRIIVSENPLPHLATDLLAASEDRGIVVGDDHEDEAQDLDQEDASGI